VNGLTRFFVLSAVGLAIYFGGFLVAVFVYDSTPHWWYLPHRPMSEIDGQGHMYLAPMHECRSVYDAPLGKLRFCWMGL
jgi:hypothetical protein